MYYHFKDGNIIYLLYIAVFCILDSCFEPLIVFKFVLIFVVLILVLNDSLFCFSSSISGDYTSFLSYS